MLGAPVTTIRDSLYDRIPLEPAAVALIETSAFLRLDRIQQLGFVSKVWPGAKHTRFEHALGVYHLTRQALAGLRRHDDRGQIDETAARTLLAAALLHDIGHYPFSHGIEELGPPVPPHEVAGRRVIMEGEIAGVLAERWRLDPSRVASLIDPRQGLLPEDRVLRGLLSGALDVDKLDYLPRDARSCNVPYGGVDVPRLLDALRIAEVDGQPRIVVTEKGVSPLASLIHARQEMFDNVYWHHTNRACMVMLLRAVQDALLAGRLSAVALTRCDDAGLLDALSSSDMPASSRGLVQALRTRRLHKRALEVSARAGSLYTRLGALYAEPGRRRQLEIALAARLAEELEIDVGAAEVLIDIPKPERWRTDVWVRHERPPLGFQRLMSWQDAVGMSDDDLKRYEEHRRLIRIVASERLRDEVAARWERLLPPLLGALA